MQPILKLEHIQKYYGNEGNITKAIRDISFSVEAGEFLGIMGASGSGKTTLLNCISTIDTVSAGHIYLGGTDVTEIQPKAIARFRRENLGFVFQDFNLLDTLTISENIALALSINKTPARDVEPRKVHKDHDKVRWAYRKAQKNLETERTEANLTTFKEARKVMLSTPHLDEMDKSYKRLQYNRYADDFLISITGSKQDAENIKEQVRIFLKDKLNLTMSEEKTHVTHSSEKVRYLGYDIRISRSQDTKRTKKGLQRVWYGKVQLYMPKEKWIAKLHEYGAFKIKKDENGKENWKPLHRGALMPLDDVAIISKYNSEIRGLYNYYRLAINVCNLGKFHSIMRCSCLKTLAAKYNSSVMKMYKKYRSEKGDLGADYKTKSGTKRCEFYNEGFRRNKNIAPEFVDIMPKYRGRIKPNSLAGRLKSGKCEMCGASPVKVYMHHVQRLKDLNADNEFDGLMLQKRRKSLALCPKCYEEAKLKSLEL